MHGFRLVRHAVEIEELLVRRCRHGVIGSGLLYGRRRCRSARSARCRAPARANPATSRDLPMPASPSMTTTGPASKRGAREKHGTVGALGGPQFALDTPCGSAALSARTSRSALRRPASRLGVRGRSAPPLGGRPAPSPVLPLRRDGARASKWSRLGGRPVGRSSQRNAAAGRLHQRRQVDHIPDHGVFAANEACRMPAQTPGRGTRRWNSTSPAS